MNTIDAATRRKLQRKTCIIIGRNGEYLVGWNYIMRRLNWSFSHYDAWRTRSPEKAEMVARRANARMFLFNPVVGRIAPYKPARTDTRD